MGAVAGDAERARLTSSWLVYGLTYGKTRCLGRLRFLQAYSSWFTHSHGGPVLL